MYFYAVSMMRVCCILRCRSVNPCTIIHVALKVEAAASRKKKMKSLALEGHVFQPLNRLYLYKQHREVEEQNSSFTAFISRCQNRTPRRQGDSNKDNKLC